MMIISRKKTATIATLVGLANNVISILLTFFLRTIILKDFSVEYVGLYSFLTQTVGILNGIDGGISSSMLIKIHKPIAENNIKEIRRNFFLIRLIYTVKGIGVIFFGTIICLSLPSLISTTIDLSIIYKCYFVYLCVSALNFTLIYYYFMLETVQKRFIASALVGITDVVIITLNIFLVKKYNNFFLYILLCVLNYSSGYYLCKLYFKRNYPEYFKQYKIEKGIWTELKDYLGMAVHTISNSVVKHSDTMLMSVLTNLAATGLYANYNLIISALQSIVQQLVSAIKDPFRNLVFSEKSDISELFIRRITFLYILIAGTMCITFCSVSDIFVNLVWGNSNVIKIQNIVYLMAISFFLLIVSNPIVDFYYCKEFYTNDKRAPIIEVVINLIISFILGWFIGISGIIIGTIFSYAYRIIHRSVISYNYMDKNLWKSYIMEIIFGFVVVFLLSVIFRNIVSSYISISNIIEFICISVICSAFSFVMICIMFHRTSEYKYFKNYALGIVHMRK